MDFNFKAIKTTKIIVSRYSIGKSWLLRFIKAIKPRGCNIQRGKAELNTSPSVNWYITEIELLPGKKSMYSKYFKMPKILWSQPDPDLRDKVHRRKYPKESGIC